MEISGLDVVYMYAFVVKNGDQAVMIFRFEDMNIAVDTMIENDIHVIDSGRLLLM